MKVIDSRLQLKAATQKFEDEMEEVNGRLHKAKHELYRRDEAVRCVVLLLVLL